MKTHTETRIIAGLKLQRHVFLMRSQIVLVVYVLPSNPALDRGGRINGNWLPPLRNALLQASPLLFGIMDRLLTLVKQGVAQK